MNIVAAFESGVLAGGFAAIVALAVALPAVAAEPADHLFVGDHILTMEGPAQESRPTAVAIRGDTIVWVGERDAASAWVSEDTEVHELGERTLLPGFIDAHGHLTYLAASLKWANLAPPPVGPVDSIASLQAALKEFIEAEDLAPGAWVIGAGYDDSLIAEQRHPTRDDLDAVSTEHPIALLHVSGHLAATNSRALAAAGISAESDDPSGGQIRRRPGSREPNGVLEETATYPVRSLLQQPSGNPIADVEDALNLYASYGITTVQDGAIAGPPIGLLENMAANGLLTLDVVIYPVVSGVRDHPEEGRQFGRYAGRLKFGGVKLVLDGSPQGKTAYLSQPYYVPPPGESADYRGYPIHQPDAVDTMVGYYLDAGIPVIAHANGDAAGELLIDAVDLAAREHDAGDHRTVMIHAQTVREDQLDRMAALGIVPSYFSAHTFFWGDWHRDSVLGPERAARISPTRSTANRGMHFTVHNDAPIVPPDMIRLLWATTNRLTRSGRVLGPDQRVSTYESLVAMTRDAAYQYFEEDTKGTLTVGKQADLVILSEDPLAMRPEELLGLDVEETWSRGVRVFDR